MSRSKRIAYGLVLVFSLAANGYSIGIAQRAVDVAKVAADGLGECAGLLHRSVIAGESCEAALTSAQESPSPP